MPAKQNCFFCKATIDWSSTTAAGAVHSSHTPASRPTSSPLNSEETGKALPRCSKPELCFQTQEKKTSTFQMIFAGEGAGSGDLQGLSFFFFFPQFYRAAAFCWGCVCQGAMPDFPCGFAVTPFLSQPHSSREELA